MHINMDFSWKKVNAYKFEVVKTIRLATAATVRKIDRIFLPQILMLLSLILSLISLISLIMHGVMYVMAILYTGESLCNFEAF